MAWLQNNWSLLIVIALIVGYMILSGKKSIKEWLLFGVSMAEKELGSGTGKLKLKTVYDAFITNYPVLSKIIPFAVFSMWVDEALEEMKEIIETNLDIKYYIEGE